MRALLRGVLVLAALLLPALAPLGATPSTNSRAVHGTVADSSGVPIPNVQVIVVSLNRTSTTDADGHFTFNGLPAGRYHLSAMLIGFAPGHADVLVPASGADVSVRIVMRRS